MERVAVKLTADTLKANKELEILMQTEGFTSNPDYLSALEQLAFSLSSAINNARWVKETSERVAKEVAEEMASDS